MKRNLSPRTPENRKQILPQSFFARPALTVARELLGKYLVRRENGRETAIRITETEAYVGPEDLACHASKGLTRRTATMFGPPGHWYVYFTYGMHWMLNVVTDKEGYPAAVLIRGAAGAPGPARLTKTLAIRGTLNGAPAERRSGLWVEDRGEHISKSKIHVAPRVGVHYAGPVWAAKPYRFLLTTSEGPIY